MALLCVYALLSAETVRAAKFTASLDRDTITLGESVSLALTFDGGSPNAAPKLPPITGLSVTPGSHAVNQSIDFGSGTVISHDTYQLTLVPQSVGDFTIPALTAEVSGEKLITQPIRLRVLKPNAPTPEAVKSGSQIAFMRIVLPKKEVYLGEVLTAELQIYFRDVVQNFGNFQFTAMPTEGFTVGKNVPGQNRRVQIGNGIYTLVPIQIALSAIKTGPLSIGPITATVVVELPSNNRQRDLFEQYGIRGLFSRGEQRQVTLATEAESVQSLPLPTANVPPNFNGAVGSYTMNVIAGPTNVATGDPITVRVQMSGRGALEALTLPAQPSWKDFKAYPPTVNLELADQLGRQGTKTFEQIVTPQSTDIHELPAFSFSFFDPDAKTYRTLTQPPVALTVRPGGAAPAPVVAAVKNSAANELPPAQDIVHIKARPGTLAQIGPPLALRPWFVAVQTAPVLAFLAAFVWRKRAESLANNPRLRRQRKVAQIIREGLEELRKHAVDKDSDAFFETLVGLLQEQIGERLDCPASAITEAVVDEKLRQRGLPETTLAALHELFQAANLARYAPMRSEQELAAIVPKLETALRALQEMKA